MKIKEGGGMGIQEEREAFECEFKQTDYYIAHGDLSTLMLCDDQYALDDVQVSFEMWQAAKAQAVPEGFVLVEKNLIKTLHEELLDHEADSFVVNRDICELWKQAND